LTEGKGAEQLHITRRRLLRSALILGPAAYLAACNRSAAVPEPTPSRLLNATPGQLTAVAAASDLAVGVDQRFPIGIIDENNRPISDATVQLAFFKVTGPSTAELRARADTTYRESPGLEGRGVFVSRADFNEAGDWGVAAQVTEPGREPREALIAFKVKPKSSTPSIGDPVPHSHTLTANTPAEVERICSARPGDDYHHLSIDQALDQGKPLAVLFATPGFCTSRTCGPSLDVLDKLHAMYPGTANYIHVEVLKDGHPPQDGGPWQYVPSVDEWGLPSEPWLFLIDDTGRLVDKFEASITVGEVQPVFAKLVGG